MKCLAETTEGKKFVVVFNMNPFYFQIKDLDTGICNSTQYETFDDAKKVANELNIDLFANKPSGYEKRV